MLRRSLARYLLPQPVLRRTDNYPHYDLCVIGSGPAGVAAGMRAASIGKKVCLVEAERLGGKEIWKGTLQSKTLWEMSRFVAKATTQPGYVDSILDPSVVPHIKAAVDGTRVMATLKRVCEHREHKVREMIVRSGIDIIRGKAIFNSDREIDIKSRETGEYRGLRADYFLLATGAAPMSDPICPIDGRHVVTTDSIFDLPIPKSLVILGAGALGCEFASMYATLGLTKVFLIDRESRVLSGEDDDIALDAEQSLMRRGVTIHQRSNLFAIDVFEEDGVGSVQYSVQNKLTGSIESNIVERALVTVGRRANYQGLGLENTKMRVSNGRVIVDDYYRCLPYQHIYCVGDAITQQKAVNMAQATARSAIQHMYGLTPQRVFSPITVNNISNAMFLEEEVASVGLNETQCREQHIGYHVAKIDNSYLARAEVGGDTHGFVKLIVTSDRQKRVLGVRAVGTHAASVVETASLAIRNRQSAYELLRNNPAYPSMVLGLVECARMLFGRGSWNARSEQGQGSNTVASIRKWEPENSQRGRAYYEEKKP